MSIKIIMSTDVGADIGEEATATVFDHQICFSKKGTVEVEVMSERAKGITFWKSGGSEKHEIVLG